MVCQVWPEDSQDHSLGFDQLSSEPNEVEPSDQDAGQLPSLPYPELPVLPQASHAATLLTGFQEL